MSGQRFSYTADAFDYLQVARTAHQLAKDQGDGAHFYAADLARTAATEGKADEAKFWNAVASALKPR